MEELLIYKQPDIKHAKMVLGLTGWMDGGRVSTGTVRYLKEKLNAKKLARIDPQNFYIFNLPGTMQQVTQFRPHCKIKDGLVTILEHPNNEFFYDEENNIILFSGKEPNLRWDRYAQCIFEVAEKFNVEKMYFTGSVAGPIPHTREVRVSCSVSNEKQKEALQDYDLRFTDYEGPASIVTLLTKQCEEKGVQMVSFVAEIPVYVQTENPKGIKAMMKRLVRLLDIDADLKELSQLSSEFEKNINELVAEQPELAKQIRKLEENYDKEFFDRRGDFEEWLKKHGIDKL